MGLKKDYENKIAKKLKKDLKLDSIMAAPRPKSVTLNIGLGEAVGNKKAIEDIEAALKQISGQKPVQTKAKKDIAGFKIRKGAVVGVMVTLRGSRMWDFLDRLVTIVLPRTRDFYGLSEKAFDGRGNYAIGVKEHVVFPEIDPNAVEKIRSMQIVISTSAKDDEEGLALLKALGFPFLDQKK